MSAMRNRDGAGGKHRAYARRAGPDCIRVPELRVREERTIAAGHETLNPSEPALRRGPPA
jgi:hypothetical protein